MYKGTRKTKITIWEVHSSLIDRLSMPIHILGTVFCHFPNELLKYSMSSVIRNPAFCICENKDADQLRCNREADQLLCLRYTDSTILLLPKSEISSLQPSSVVVQPGLCPTWSETLKTGFHATRLIMIHVIWFASLSEALHRLVL